ncbi:MAG: hypothetical protein FD123_1341 [Bacteroidetes bacterium]|nr:MAG: hypothetical protein FD123_1341 [Bacteroidota bacterium]
MIDWKKNLQHAGFIVLFIILCFAFFKPYLVDKRAIAQNDIEQHKGMSKEIADHRAKYHEEPLWTNAMFGGMPAYQISTNYKGNYISAINTIFRGIIHHPVTFVLVCMVGFYILLLTLNMSPLMSAAGAIAFAFSSYFFTLIPAGHNSKGMAIAYMAPVIAGVLMTFRGRLLLGGALTALALALELEANHIQITFYLILISLAIGIGELIRLWREGKREYLFKAVGILVVAALLGALPNISNLLLTQEYAKDSMRGGSVLTINERGVKKTAEEEKEPGLKFDYAMGWSYGVGETMTLLIPNYNGGASLPVIAYDEKALEAAGPDSKDYIGGRIDAYFGDQPFTSGPAYVGAIVCFFFLLCMVFVKDRLKWWLFGISVLGIMLAWGYNFEPLSRFFFDHVPLYNKFRAPAMTLVIVEFTFPLMALLAIKEIITNRAVIREKIKIFYGVTGFALAVCLVVWMSPDSFVTPTGPELDAKAVRRIESDLRQQKAQEMMQRGMPQQQVAMEMQKPEVQREIKAGALEFHKRIQPDIIAVRLKLTSDDAIRSFLFILLAAGITLVFIRVGFNQHAFAGAVLILVMIDQIPVAHRYVNDNKYNSSYAENPTRKNTPVPEPEKSKADSAILQDPDPNYRVLNTLASVTDDASTSYYHKSLGGYHPAKMRRYQDLVEFYIENQRIESGNLINQSMGNDSMVQAGLAKMGVLNMLNTRYIIFNPGYRQGVMRNRNALGNAWFVEEVMQVQSPDEEIVKLGKIDPGKTALVDKAFAVAPQKVKKDPDASITLTSYKANELKYQSKNNIEQVGVFSEIYYEKGWNAYIDNKLVPHFRADYTLRGLKIPAGNHEIVFKFEPKMYNTGGTIASIGSLLILAFLGFAIWKEIKDKKDKPGAAKT